MIYSKKKKVWITVLLNCESQFSTYHVITNKATAVSCTTITRPPQSSAGVGESPEMLKNLTSNWIICLCFLGVWNWWKRSYVSHTIVGWLVTAAVNEHQAQLRCAYNQTMWFRGCQPSTSVLPLLPLFHIVLQGRKAAGVAVHGGHRAVLVVLLVLSPPGDPLLVVGLQHIRADGGHSRDGGRGGA